MRSSAIECVGAILCQHTFWRLRWGEINLVFKTDLIYSSKKMGSSEIDKENIITATMEELTEEERKAYLIAEEHLREHFLQGFKKERRGLFKRVGEFVMPSFKLNQDKVEVLPNDPSELVKHFSLMVDSKISAAQVAAGESFVGLNDQMEKGLHWGSLQSYPS